MGDDEYDYGVDLGMDTDTDYPSRRSSRKKRRRRREPKLPVEVPMRTDEDDIENENIGVNGNDNYRSSPEKPEMLDDVRSTKKLVTLDQKVAGKFKWVWRIDLIANIVEFAVGIVAIILAAVLNAPFDSLLAIVGRAQREEVVGVMTPTFTTDWTWRIAYIIGAALCVDALANLVFKVLLYKDYYTQLMFNQSWYRWFTAGLTMIVFFIGFYPIMGHVDHLVMYELAIYVSILIAFFGYYIERSVVRARFDYLRRNIKKSEYSTKQNMWAIFYGLIYFVVAGFFSYRYWNMFSTYATLIATQYLAIAWGFVLLGGLIIFIHHLILTVGNTPVPRNHKRVFLKMSAATRPDAYAIARTIIEKLTLWGYSFTVLSIAWAGNTW